LKLFSIELGKEIAINEDTIYQHAGRKFNMNSPAQLGEVLFDEMKLVANAKRTGKSKQYATGEDVLQSIAHLHPIVADILNYRSLTKLKSTYVDALPLLIHPLTGRVHTNFQQAVAATGRLSSVDPNLQNIPIRTERGREIRKAFTARKGDYILLSSDYSQIELRLIAEMSNEVNMIEAFKAGVDIHKATAAKVYSVDLENVTSDMRRNAKMVNFGIIYGISAFGLAQRLGVSRTEASELIKAYNAQYPGIKAYMDAQIKYAKENGFVKTITGRRRNLRDINSANATTRGYAERNAINAPIQGSAADLIKIAMINIHKEFKLRGLQSKMILQVHDELLFDVHVSEKEVVKQIVEDKMRTAMPNLKVPIDVESGFGENWLAAH
jgi:DNA polymerase-1